MSKHRAEGLRSQEPQGRGCTPAGWGWATASSPQDELGALEGIFRDYYYTWRQLPQKGGLPADQRMGAQRHCDLSYSQHAGVWDAVVASGCGCAGLGHGGWRSRAVCAPAPL